jgi:hypothetical protein
MSKTKGYALIKQAKKNPGTGRKRFRVNNIGGNGEPLGSSEVVESYNNAIKNIVAHLNLYGGSQVLVKDLPNKVMIIVYSDGKVKPYTKIK